MSAIIPKSADDLSAEQQYYNFFINNLLAALAIAVHIAYAVALYFLSGGDYPLWSHMLGCVFFVVAVLLNMQGVQYVPFFIMVMEINLFTVIWTVQLGIESGLVWFTILSLLGTTVVSQLLPWHRIVLTLLTFLSLNLSLLYGLAHKPLYVLPHIELLSIASVNAVLVAFVLLLSMSNIANKAAQSRYLRQLETAKNDSMIDPLTGLWNRRYFHENETYFSEQARTAGCCVAMLDIDHFKNINDTYGHGFGDEVLQHFAGRLRGRLRAQDVIIRWGGEEFVVLLLGTSLSNAQRIIDELRQEVRADELYYAEGNADDMVSYTFTAGVSEVASRLSMTEALSNADKNLYFGKQNGRDQVVF